MNVKNAPMQTVELFAEQNANMIDGVMNNTPPQFSQPEEKPPDKVRGLPRLLRYREREER